MARRKKEDPCVHRDRISGIAEQLFAQNGVAATSMDLIAGKAGYSKATLYVYFKNKDEIIAYLTLKSLQLLKETVVRAIEGPQSYKDKFVGMGFALSEYADKYPDYYRIIMKTIQFDENNADDDYSAQAFRIGEQINIVLLGALFEGVEKGVFKKKEYKIEDVLQIWGMISGLIQIAEQKEKYIIAVIGKSKEEFLREGFGKIYSLISDEKES